MVLIHPNKKIAKDDLGIFYRIEEDKLIDPSIGEPFYFINLLTGDLVDEAGNDVDYKTQAFTYPKDLLEIGLESTTLTIDEYLKKSKELTGISISKAAFASTVIRKLKVYILKHLHELMESIFIAEPEISRRDCYTAFSDLVWHKLEVNSEAVWKEIAPAMSYAMTNLYNPQEVAITDLDSIKTLFADPEKAILLHVHEDVYKAYISVGQELNSVENPDINTIDDLLNATIEKDETLTVNPNFKIDTGQRELPFIFIDDHLVWGKHEDWHEKILKEYFDRRGIEIKSLSYWPRSLADLKVLNGKEFDATTPFGAGFKNDNIAVIEAEEHNALPKMINLLKAKFEKVYIFYKARNRIKRLAKQI